MSVLKTNQPLPMTVAEFLDWADRQPGRFELVHGEPVAMTPPLAAHSRVKFAIANALAAAIKHAGKPCEAFIDGPGVKHDEINYYIPDVVVACGERVSNDDRHVASPVIVVEVTSPSTAWLDNDEKLTGYFTLASVQHYLIVNPRTRTAVHHRRDGDKVSTTFVKIGSIALDPPGLTIEAGEMFASL